MSNCKSAKSKKPLSADLPSILLDDQVLNFKQAAKFRGVSISTMRRLHTAGKLRVVRLSERRLGVRVADLKEDYSLDDWPPKLRE